MMNGETQGKEKYLLEKRDIPFIFLFILASVFTVIFALWGGFKIGFTFSYLFFFTVASLYLYKKENKMTVFGTLSGVFSVISAFVFGYSNNFGVNFCLFAVMFFESTVWFNMLSGISSGEGDLSLVGKAFSTVFGKSFGKLFKTLASVFDSKNEKINFLGKALIGILVSLPLLCVIIPLLVSADGAFEGLISKIGENVGKLLKQLALGLLFSPLLISYSFSMRKDEKKDVVKKESKGIENVYVISFLSALALVYLVYLFSQLAYFINGFFGILPDKFIPSSYARRGFFEMSIIAGINFVIIYLSLVFSRQKDNKPSRAVGGISAFIIVFTIFLICTALAKMFMYIGYFGLTVLRVTTSAFMVFLLVVFAVMLFRCFIKKVPVIKVMLITASCVLLLLGFFNTESIVAEYNVNAYKEEKLETIDIYTLRNLGLSGVPALYDVYKNVPEYEEEAKEALLRLRRLKNYEREIGEWSFTDQRAYNILERFEEENGLGE